MILRIPCVLPADSSTGQESQFEAHVTQSVSEESQIQLHLD